MRIRMKKIKSLNKLIFFCLLSIIISLISELYSDELFMYFFILEMLVPALLIIISIVLSIRHLIRNHKSVKDFIPLILICAYILFSVGGGKDDLNFVLYKNRRYKVIEMVETEELNENVETGLIELPSEYKIISSGGEIKVFRNFDNNQKKIVGFWIMRGFLDSGFTMYVYDDSNNEDNLRKAIEMEENFYQITLEKKEDNWYYVKAKEPAY